MPYAAMDFEKLIGMEGFSETALKNHFTLYQGYVANTNKLSDLIGAMAAEGKTGVPEFAELKRRFGWEWNGMRLHELYFGNLGGKKALDPLSKLGKALTAEFKSIENWEADFRAVGAMRGIGWVILYHDKGAGRLFNQWVNEHDVGNLAGAAPLFIMDVFEHAFFLDYGLKRADYIAAFWKNVNWEVVEARL
ncbi:MAG: Fe-Mn family superoxide dismutase [Syntrophorhabdaceae bacterium]|nr:Fe-Mn family superoxide dismutase [Syntrophorhabdaceae bacterium]